MGELSDRIELAKADNQHLEALMADYLPFIKAEIAKVSANGLEYDDKLSLGMLVFMNCVRQYHPSRGGFISYTSVCIRNRLLDETRKLKRTRDNTVLFAPGEGEEPSAFHEDKASLVQYSLDQEQAALQAEIAALSDALSAHGLSFLELARIGPKQKRSRRLCAQVAKALWTDKDLYKGFSSSKLLPQAALAGQLNISPKTIEKHRRYIVALVLIFSGDYPSIGTYIPGYREVE